MPLLHPGWKLSQRAEEAYDSELMDSGVDDDEWQPDEEDYRSEPQSTADAAAAAAAAVAAVGRRRTNQDTSGLIMLGKRRRGRQRQADSDGEELYDSELYGDDDEVKGECGWQELVAWLWRGTHMLA